MPERNDTRKVMHGELVNFRHRQYRWCEVHKVLHGRLYDCPEFPQAVRYEIWVADSKMKAALGAAISLAIIFICMALSVGQ